MSDARVLTGDCREVLRSLPDESVHCVVTSPPYWGLRDYRLPPTIWGGVPACTHSWSAVLKPSQNGSFDAMAGETKNGNSATRKPHGSLFCNECGAWSGQLGLEPTPGLYVKHMVEVFREVRRVLRADGTLWLNIGDTYASGKAKVEGYTGSGHDLGWANDQKRDLPPGLKPKDLVLIPARVALALQEDGWWIRSDIIWHKPNPMPESVTDRPTKSHEYLFLLSKSERYYYDADAVAEPAGYAHEAVYDNGENGHGGGVSHAGQGSSTRKFRSGNKDRKFRGDHGGVTGSRSHQGFGVPWEGITRNRRSVWTIATQAFDGAHFATFPPKLIEPCILAGSPQGGVVLDPFAGSGTTGVVASTLGRSAILIELNPEYAEMARTRCANAPMSLFSTNHREP